MYMKHIIPSSFEHMSHLSLILASRKVLASYIRRLQPKTQRDNVCLPATVSDQDPWHGPPTHLLHAFHDEERDRQVHEIRGPAVS